MKLPIIFARDRLEISVDRLNTTPKLVIMYRKREVVSLLEQRFFYFLGSRAKVTRYTVHVSF